MDVFTTRKIISGFVLLITGIAVTVIKGDIPSNLLSLMQVLYATFVAGNAAQHYTSMKSVQVTTKEESNKNE